MPNTHLITAVHTLAGSDIVIFSDTAVAGTLEARSLHFQRQPLYLVKSDAKTETWASMYSSWSKDTVLECENRFGVEIVKADLERGEWQITKGHEHLMVSGISYDPHGSARDLLRLAARLAEGDEQKRMLARAADLHKQSRPIASNIPRPFTR